MALLGSVIELGKSRKQAAAQQLLAAVKLVTACAQETDGALSVTAWLKWKCKLSGGAAAERVEIGKQLEHLPRTGEAFARGNLGFQHVAVMARTAEHLGAAAVRSQESNLLNAAKSLDPGQFTTVAKNFEHTVDAAGALAETNRASTFTSASPSMAWSGSTAC